jgi:4'-phosphopantetheinyl transferase
VHKRAALGRKNALIIPGRLRLGGTKRHNGAIVESLKSDNEIHVWSAPLEDSRSHIDAASLTLSRDERKRAEQFRFSRERNAFVLRRGILRVLLSRYLDMEPQEIRIGYSQNGKPELELDGGAGGTEGAVSFNYSHSGDLAVYAIAMACAVGVDVERRRPVAEAQEIAEKYLSLQARAALANVPDHEKSAAFLDSWTRREALIKAAGCGLPVLDSPTSASSEFPRECLDLDLGTRNGCEWMLHRLSLKADYLGALAYQCPARRVREFSYVSLKEAVGGSGVFTRIV